MIVDRAAKDGPYCSVAVDDVEAAAGRWSSRRPGPSQHRIRRWSHDHPTGSGSSPGCAARSSWLGGLGSPHSNPSRAVVMKRYIRIVCVTVSEEIFVAWRVILTEGLDCAAETLESVPVRFVEGLHHSRPTVWQGILTPVERGRYRQFYTVCNVSMTKESRVNVAVSRSGSPNPRTS